ncbi:MAG: NAD(P)-dependent oxidoreductase [Planctomycetota bacterium]|nr:NAD(P)-dependent oxidoreductase [Planctomycetota bacterium]
MHIALTGVSGFIGSAIARHLHAAGHTVTGLVRETSRRDHVEAFVERFVVGNHDDTSCWDEFLDGSDCVIHNSVDWAPLKATPVDLDGHLRSNLDASIRLLHASSPRQFIFVSTIAVHHDMLERERAADGTNLITEDHPLRPSRLYGAYKAAVEAHLWAEHFGAGRNTSAVRPCAVYGVDPNLERSHGYGIIRELLETGRCDRLGGGKYVHVDDVAAVIGAIVGNDAAVGAVGAVGGKPFNLVDCYARHADWALMAAEVLGLDPDRVTIDTSSPTLPKNSFSKAAVESLGGGEGGGVHRLEAGATGGGGGGGVRLDRGHAGIRASLESLVAAMGLGSGGNAR